MVDVCGCLREPWAVVFAETTPIVESPMARKQQAHATVDVRLRVCCRSMMVMVMACVLALVVLLRVACGGACGVCDLLRTTSCCVYGNSAHPTRGGAFGHVEEGSARVHCFISFISSKSLALELPLKPVRGVPPESVAP